MEKVFFIGIDSGGTKTAISVIDKNQNEVLSFQTGTGHYLQIGFQGLENLLTEITNKIYNDLNITSENIGYIFAGIPGYGEIKEDKLKIDQLTNKVWNNINFKIGNDMEAGWAGSLACEPGINIIAGTGAIGYGINAQGEQSRSSGWGPICGDEGSAYWIGKKSLEIFTKESDGRLEKTPLYEIFKNELNLQDDFDIVNLIHNQYQLDRGKIAKLSLLVYKAALKNDKYAISIFKEAAEEIGLMIKAIMKDISFENHPVKVSYTGGVFQSGDYIFNPLKEYLKNNNLNIEIIDPKYSAVEGSALYGLKLYQKEIGGL